MTGNFKIIMIYSEGKDPKYGWIIHKDNTTPLKFYNYNSIMNDTSITKITKDHLKRLFTHYSISQLNEAWWRADDRRRKLDLGEYMTLAYKLRSYGFKYNKKTDKLITI